MGWERQKYTRTYFIKESPDGTKVNYGAEGYNEFLEGKIREIDLSILKRLNFAGKRVFEFGFGRGEAIKYAYDSGCAYYEGVDFSEAAVEIAREFLALHNYPVPTLHHSDALEFVKNYVSKLSIEATSSFDIILMLDFIEHVPRYELKEIMIQLHEMISDFGILVINTPAYRIDNDVVKDGLNELNNIESVDLADLINETKGMHCNKYTIISLQEFMHSCGFYNFTEAHFFAPETKKNTTFIQILSYKIRWEKALHEGRPLCGAYEDDVVEYAYKRPQIPKWHSFQTGILQDITLLLVDDYIQFFPHGNYDIEVYNNLRERGTEGNIIFDIGGFMGVSSLLFSRLTGLKGLVICFEPNPWNVNRICLNFSKNSNFASRTKLYNMAVGDQTGSKEMFITDNVDSGHSSTSQFTSSHGCLPRDYLKKLGFRIQNVPVSTIDDFVAYTGIIPDIIKIDVEGAEHNVLAGCIETINSNKPKFYIEIHSAICAMRCTTILKELGYNIETLKKEKDNRLMIYCNKIYDSTHTIKSNLKNSLLKMKYEDIELENTTMKDFIEDLEQKLKSLQDNLDQEIKQNSELKSAIQNLEATNILLQDNLNETNKQNSELKNAIQNIVETYRKQNSDMQEVLMKLQCECDNFRRLCEHPIIKTQRKIWYFIKKILFFV